MLFAEILEDRRLLAVSFEFNYLGGSLVGFNDPLEGPVYRSALQSAATRLGDWLLHEATIQIDVTSRAFDGTAVAKATSTPASPLAEGGFAHALIPDKIINGVDHNGATADGTLEVFFFGGSDSFTYVTDPNNVDADDEIDFQAVIIHELVHTLGMTSRTNADGSDDNGNGITTPGTWSVFDQFLSDAAGNRLIDSDAASETAFRMQTDSWLTHSVGGKGPNAGLFFDGPMATRVYGGRVPLYSPSTFSLESSVSHLDSEGFPNESFLFSPLTHLMSHAIIDDQVPQSLTLLEKAILSDIGIRLIEDVDPQVTAPVNLVVEANNRGGFLGTNPAIADYLNSAIVVDQVDPQPVVTNDKPTLLALGQNTITFTATDASGNTGQATSVISVLDTTPPTLDVSPGEVVLEATSPEGVIDPNLPFVPVANDIVDPNPVIAFNGGNTFPIGRTSAEYSATDFRKNVATFEVEIIVQDTTPPQFDLPPQLTIASNLTDGADLNNLQLQNVIESVSSDLADLNLEVSANPTQFPLGTSTVTLTVTDDSGNSSSRTTSMTVTNGDLVVHTLDDELDSNPESDLSDLSLREAISIANSRAGLDNIRFDADLTGSILIDAILGQLIVTDSVNVYGSGIDKTVIDGQSNSRVFAIAGTQLNVSLQDMSIQGGQVGNAFAGGAGVFFDSEGTDSKGTLSLERVRIAENTTLGEGGAGGGIHVSKGDLLLVDSEVTGNQTRGDFAGGGGIWINDGDLSLVRSRLVNNSTSGNYASAGSLYALDSLTTITESTISGNSTIGVRSGGGGLAIVSGEAKIRSSTISNNSTSGTDSPGGGVRSLLSPTNLINSTISGNTTDSLSSGGGLYADRSPLSIANTTITGNLAAGFGGGVGLPVGSTSNMTIRNSIVAANQDGGLGPDLSGTGGLAPEDAVRHSLIGDNTGTMLAESTSQDAITGNLVGDPDGSGSIDPMLSALADNGGPTMTHMPLPESPTIDAGDPNFDAAAYQPALLHDQRGSAFSRVNGSYVDMGAVEAVILVAEDLDFGDAPIQYPVLLSQNGPHHAIGSLYLGSQVDAETDGQPSNLADGDQNDEDGVQIVASAIATSDSQTSSSWLIEASEAGRLDAWIDFNQDGDWTDPGEQVHVNVELDSGPNLLAYHVPVGATTGDTFARLRVSTTGGLSATGAAADGEVEDHLITLLDGNNTPDAAVDLINDSSEILVESNQIIVRQATINSFLAPLANVGSLTISGAATDDFFTIDLGGDWDPPTNGLQIDGATGENRLLVKGNGFALDLTNPNLQVSHFQFIDLSSSDSNQLVLDAVTVDALSPTNQIVDVLAGQEDQLSVANPTAWRMSDPIIINGNFVLTAVHSGGSGEKIQAELPRAWTNFLQRGDVDNNGQVAASDALSIINEVSRNQYSDPDTKQVKDPLSLPEWPGLYYDHNGDQLITALDALGVINDVGRASAANENAGNTGAAEGELPDEPNVIGSRSFTSLGLIETDRGRSVDQDVNHANLAGIDANSALSPSEASAVVRIGDSTCQAAAHGESDTRNRYESEVDQLLVDHEFFEDLGS